MSTWVSDERGGSPMSTVDIELGPVPSRARGVIGLIEEACTSCMLCVRECPTWCISLDSHTEAIPGAPFGGGQSGGGRGVRTQHVLDEFSIDFGLCMNCGICVEVCPFDALEWHPAHDYAQIADAPSTSLLHTRTRLATHLSR